MIKRFIKKLIPFYTAYSRSTKSTIHNQSYWGYVRFRLTGKCNGGGIIQSIQHVQLLTFARSM